ncbi:ABC transporter permease [Knoellia koreensis]|uniref:ABC transporter permease n=1 Tax=Knoellia koreensis TaxID=2730921 RepID=A0A849HIS1_9MICO|nr:ABC transporter permease [Knoellia sp. DB2414S]NNM47089.1 ABC transporter permease [Knoellia sp. DB2414S]
MTTTLDNRTTSSGGGSLPPARVAHVTLAQVYRFELVKLLAQWRLRAVFLACLVAPALYTAVVSSQTSLPADFVFGRWMNQTGWAGSLVVLVFTGTLALPLVTCVISGDIFAVEDRLGTWRHLLVTVRSPRLIFAGKALAALTVTLALFVPLVLSSVAGGLLVVGSHPMPGLDGHLIGSGELARLVALSWVSVVPPTLAFSAIGLLGSVAFGRSPLGLLMPVAFALVLELVHMLPVPVALRAATPTSPFTTYRGFFTDPPQLGMFGIGLVVSAAWIALATYLAQRMFVRRDFTDLGGDGSSRRFALTGLLPLVALLAVTTAVVAAVTGVTGTGVDRAKVERSLATSFSHLYVLQTRELNRPAVTESQLRTTAECDKGGSRVEDVGPGNDWRCVVTWTVPGADGSANAIYQLDVLPDGRYTADGDGPKEVNGYFLVRTKTGDAPNPLWQFDGLVDLLTQ